MAITFTWASSGSGESSGPVAILRGVKERRERDVPVAVDRRTGIRRVHPAAANSFELFVALLSINAGIAFLLSPDDLEHAAVGQLLHPWDFAWNVLYIVGGVLIVLGLTRARVRVELAGLWLFASALAIADMAVVAAAGVMAAAAVAVYTAALLACVTRIWTLQGRRR